MSNSAQRGPIIGDVIFHSSIEIDFAGIPGIHKKGRVVKVENSRVICVGVLHTARMEGHLVIMLIARKVAAHRC